MSHRPGDERQTEWTKWVAIFPGAPSQSGEDHVARRFIRKPLQRPVLTMLAILAAAVILGGGAYALFGAGGPALSADHEAVAATLDLNGTICCLERREIDDGEYLFVTVLEPRGFFSTTPRDVSLRVISLANGEMEQIASIDAPIDSALPRSMAVAGATVYTPLGVSDDDPHGLWMVDISNPGVPADRGVHAMDHRLLNVAAGPEPEQSIIAHSTMGFTIYDASDAEDLVRISELERPQADAVSLQMNADGLLAYHADLAGPIFLWDFSDPGEPKPFGRYGDQLSLRGQAQPTGRRDASAEDFLDRRAPAGRFHDFVIDDGVMYVAASDDGLQIVDLSDPAEPDTLETIQLNGRVVRTALDEDTLYAVTVFAESRERLSYQVHQFDRDNQEDPGLVSTIEGIRAAPGRQAVETGGGFLFLGFNDTVLMLETGG